MHPTNTRAYLEIMGEAITKTYLNGLKCALQEVIQLARIGQPLGEMQHRRLGRIECQFLGITRCGECDDVSCVDNPRHEG